MTTQIKLQVPMDKSVRDGLEKRATELGFDSAQAYIRFWAKAQADGRKVNLDMDDWGEPSDAAAKRINRDADEARRGINVSEPFSTVEEFMKDLRA